MAPGACKRTRVQRGPRAMAFPPTSAVVLLLLCLPLSSRCQSNLEKYSISGCNPNIGPQQCFKVGIVSSMTGELTDWNESLRGWRVYKFKIEQEHPNGIPIFAKDGIHRFSFDLDWRDDNSSPEKHQAELIDLLDNSGVDFIANAQPNFAVEEAFQSNERGIINLHGATSNPALYERDLPMVFGLAQPVNRFFPEVIKQFKDAGVQKVAIVYREDLAELKAICQAAIEETDAELLVVQDLPFTTSDPEVLMEITRQISLSSDTEAVVGCTLAVETHQFIKNIDELQKPLKGILFTNGPHNLTFLEEVGELAENVLQPVSWNIDTPVTDFLMVNSVEFSLLTNFLVGTFPTHIDAGAAACAYVLQVAVQNAFTVCDLSQTGGDAHAILFGDENGPLITCDDNQNNGKQRVVDYLSEIAIDVFFGKVLFNEVRQNFASEVKTLQVFRKTEDLQPFLGPSIVLPLNLAQKPIVMPQPNRYKVICSPGSYQNPDEFEPCIPCAPGLFQSEPGFAFCYRCFKNFYVSEGGAEQCNRCPINSETDGQGASDITQCSCKEGYYTKERRNGTPCEPCPEHATCAGGVDPPRNLPGWHAEVDKPFFMYDCNPGSLCTGNYTCEVGYQGRMCVDCADGYFRAFDNCLECISPAGNIIAMLCMYGLFVYVVVGVSRNMETIHLLMNFCQTLSIIALFNMQWPLIFEQIFNIAGILSFEMDIIQPQCATENWGFAENLYIQLSYPAFFFVFQGLWVGAIYLAYRAKMRMNGKSMDDFSSASFSDSLARRSSNSGSQKSFTSNKSFGSANMDALQVSGLWLVFQNFFHIPSSPQEMNEVILEKMSVPFMAFNLGYVVILKYCLQAFSCLDFEGTYYMYFNPSQMCYTPKHFEMMIAAGAGLVLYVAGTLLMFIYVLYTLKKTKSFSKKRPLLLFGWMYERYESQFFWFELSVLFEKTILVVVAVFIKTDPILQVVIMLIVTLATMLLSIKTSAPVDSTTAMLLTATEGCQMVIMVLGLIFYNAQTLDRTYTIVTVIGSVALIGLLAALTAVFFVEVAFQIVITVLKARHKNVALKWGQDSRLHTHMYRVFKPWFMFKWLSKAEPDDWLYWHRLCKLFHDSVHPTCETSYLSHEKVGHFWGYLINSFPEMLDFLASVEEVDRNEFVNVIDVMYEHYFDSSQVYKCQLNSVITDRFRAAIGQWLSSASDSEMIFVRRVITRAFAKAQGKDAEQDISRAFSRSSKSRGVSSNGGDPATKKLLGNFEDEEDGYRTSLAGTSDIDASARGKLFTLTSGLTSGDRPSLNGSPRQLGKKSSKVSPAGVMFADNSPAPSPLGRNSNAQSPFAAAQGLVEQVKVEPGKENGNNSNNVPSSFGTVASNGNGNPQNGEGAPVAEQTMQTPRDKPMSPSRSNGLAASSSKAPQEVAIDTEELLRIQNSPRTSGQPQPQVQPPRLSVPAPASASIPPPPKEADISVLAPADAPNPSPPEEAKNGHNGYNGDKPNEPDIDLDEQLLLSPRGSPGDMEKAFHKHPFPRSQSEAPAAHTQPTDNEPPTAGRPKTSDDTVRSFHDLD